MLHPASFSLSYGEIVGVVGANGAGKTTLLRMLAGDLLPTAGTVAIASTDDRGRPLRTRVTFVPQTLNPWLGTLRDHLQKQAAFHGYNDLTSNSNEVNRVVDLLGLERHMTARWDELSAGYRERAAVAAALVANPGVLVLDEPLAPMDPWAQQRFLTELKTRAQGAKTVIVLSSQHIPEVESIANAIARIEDRRVEFNRVALEQTRPGFRFELGVPSHDRTRFYECLDRLRSTQTIASFILGWSLAAVRFTKPQTLEGVIKMLDPKPLSVRDISRSVLARMYPEIHWRSVKTG
jgi:ABC-2 type transport system ATP-binding protein